MRYGLTLMMVMMVAGPAAQAQTPTRPGCRDCDSTSFVLAPSREEGLADHLARLRAEIMRLRADLARTNAIADSASARALRTTIASLELSQQHLEEAIREHAVVVRSRQHPERELRESVMARAPQIVRAPEGYVGVTMESRYTVTETTPGRVAQYVDYPVIVSVEPGSPAFRAGLAAGDTVVSVNSRDGRRAEQVMASLMRPGETVVFRIRRGEALRSIPVRVDARTRAAVVAGGAFGRGGTAPFDTIRAGAFAGRIVSARPSPAVGATSVTVRGRAGGGGSAVFIIREPMGLAGAWLEPVQRDLAAKLGVEHGLYVFTVAPQTPFSRAGLQAGDVIIGAGERPLASLPQLYDVMQSASARAVTLRVVRENEPRTVTVRW